MCEASSPRGLGTQVNNQNEGLYPQTKLKVISSLKVLSVWYFVRQQQQQQKINSQHLKSSLRVVLHLVFSEQKKIPNPKSRIWDPVDPAVLCHLSKNFQKSCHKAELEFLRKMILGAGEVAQGLKLLQHEHKDQSSDPPNSCKRQEGEAAHL